jgi:hypothetical protein
VGFEQPGSATYAGWLGFRFSHRGGLWIRDSCGVAAPFLNGLGFSALPILLLCLILNAIPRVSGAVETPLWLG